MQTEPEIIMRFRIHEVWGFDFDFDLEFEPNSSSILRPERRRGFLVSS